MSQTANGNPHIYGHGTDLSSAYTHGRNGLKCPNYLPRGSASHKAWERGHGEWVRAGEGQPSEASQMAYKGDKEAARITEWQNRFPRNPDGSYK